MKNLEDKILFAFYGVFGGVLGFLIFAYGLGGWRFIFLGRATRPWNGVVALVLCSAIGVGWGLVSYLLRNREFGSGRSDFYADEAGGTLFAKRVMVLATCLAGAYFIWQLAKDFS